MPTGHDTGLMGAARLLAPPNIEDDTAAVNTLQADTFSILVAPALPEPTVPAPTLVDTVLALPGTFVSTALNLITQALSPLFGPGAPADNPALWAVLAFVRRQFNQSIANSTPVLNPRQTSQDIDDGQVCGTFGGTDADGDTLAYAVPVTGLGAPVHGTVEIDQGTGTYTYTPSAGYVGEDYFFVTATDDTAAGHIHALGQTHLAAARVDVTVAATAPINTAPIAGAPPASGTIDQTTGVITGQILATDPDGDQLVYGLLDTPDQVFYTVEIDSDTGAFVFTPTVQARHRAALDTDATTITFTVAVSDGKATIDVVIPAPVIPLHPAADGVLDLADLQDLTEYGDVEVSEDEDGIIHGIDGQFTTQIVRNTTDAAQVLNEVAEALGAPEGFADSGFFNVSTTGFIDGDMGAVAERFYRLTQVRNGVPVLGGEVILATNADGSVTGLFSGLDRGVFAVDTTPDASVNDAGAAASKAIEAILAGLTAPPDDASMTAFLNSLTIDPFLVVYDLDEDIAPTLAWRVNVYTTPSADDVEPVDTGLPTVSSIYYFYANGEHVGEVLAEDSSIKGIWMTVGTTAQGLNHGSNPTYYDIVYQQDGTRSQLIDPYRGITTYRATLKRTADGKSVYIQLTSAQIVQRGGNSAWDQSVVSLHGNTEIVYDYYRRVLGRTSFNTRPNGQPEPVKVSIVTPEQGFDAAFDSNLRNFGFAEDTEAALDAVGHEYTHGVINSIVGHSISGGSLGTSTESRALEEAYADILGGLIENKTDAGRWLVGEDADGDPYRDMKNPNSLDGVRGYDYRVTWGERGPNYYENSTIFSHAAYLMMDTKAATKSVSNETWAKVFYGSLQRLDSGATFLQARSAVVSAAKAQGFDAAQQQAIKDSFDQVGIKENPVVRIVLRWGASPVDLDSHLTGPAANGRFHIAWYQPDYYSGHNRLAADIDYDDTTSYGPESTTIHDLAVGDYYFYVHDYSDGDSTNSTALARSGATVTITSVVNNRVSTTVFRTDGHTAGTIWAVLKVSISGPTTNRTVTVTPVNSYRYGDSTAL